MSILCIVALVILSISNILIRFVYSICSRIISSLNYTGYSITQYMLNNLGLHQVGIRAIDGVLTDCYDGGKRCVFLSSKTTNESSIASVGIALHEVGHALQYENGDKIIELRNKLYFIASIAETVGIPLMLMGIAWTIPGVIGFILMSLLLAFQMITLPTEIGASKNAVEMLKTLNMSKRELRMVKILLGVAAFTYVASLCMTSFNFFFALFSKN